MATTAVVVSLFQLFERGEENLSSGNFDSILGKTNRLSASPTTTREGRVMVFFLHSFYCPATVLVNGAWQKST